MRDRCSPFPHNETRREEVVMSKLQGVLASAAAGLALLAGAAITPAAAQDKLSYFTWDGYELPDFHKSFEAAHPNSLDVSKFGDDDEAFTKVKAGFKPDLAHPCYDKIVRWKDAG